MAFYFELDEQLSRGLLDSIVVGLSSNNLQVNSMACLNLLELMKEVTFFNSPFVLYAIRISLQRPLTNFYNRMLTIDTFWSGILSGVAKEALHTFGNALKSLFYETHIVGKDQIGIILIEIFRFDDTSCGYFIDDDTFARAVCRSNLEIDVAFDLVLCMSLCSTNVQVVGFMLENGFHYLRNVQLFNEIGGEEVDEIVRGWLLAYGIGRIERLFQVAGAIAASGIVALV